MHLHLPDIGLVEAVGPLLDRRPSRRTSRGKDQIAIWQLMGPSYTSADVQQQLLR